MVTDGLGHLFATAEPCSHQGEGVTPVEGGTWRADSVSARAACLEQYPVGEVPAVEPYLRESSFSNTEHRSRQPHWSSTSSNSSHLGAELVDSAGGVQSSEDAIDLSLFVPLLPGFGDGGRRHSAVPLKISARRTNSCR